MNWESAAGRTFFLAAVLTKWRSTKQHLQRLRHLRIIRTARIAPAALPTRRPLARITRPFISVSMSPHLAALLSRAPIRSRATMVLWAARRAATIYQAARRGLLV